MRSQRGTKKAADVAVIGGGPAGMAAAISAVENGAEHVLLVEREARLGGILNQCTHSGFGLTYFGEELTGQEYAARFLSRVSASSVEVLTDTTAVGFEPDGTLMLSGPECGFICVTASATIMSTGCRERPIGALPVCGTRPAGIFTAGAAQKMLNLGGYNLGTRFVILGSGDVGLIVARQLIQSGKEVVAVVEQNEKCGGLPRNRINCLERYAIPLLTNTTISEVFGTRRITGVGLTLASGREQYIHCDTLITSVGLIPERELLSVFDSAEQLPAGLFLCGNACYVHDTVDEVTVEAERVGRLAADFAHGGVNPNTDLILSEAVGTQDSADSGNASDLVLCTACPKGCIARHSEDGWLGLSCGRTEPYAD